MNHPDKDFPVGAENGTSGCSGSMFSARSGEGLSVHPEPEYSVLLSWDGEAGVWTASSADLPGLALESGSADALMERVRYAAPELLELNGLRPEGVLRFSLERAERLTA